MNFGKKMNFIESNLDPIPNFLFINKNLDLINNIQNEVNVTLRDVNFARPIYNTQNIYQDVSIF